MIQFVKVCILWLISALSSICTMLFVVCFMIYILSISFLNEISHSIEVTDTIRRRTVKKMVRIIKKQVSD